MLGRRGPVQAAFTTPELIELGELAGATSSSIPPTSSSTRRARPRSRATRTRRGTSRCCASTRPRPLHGHPKRLDPPLPRLAGRARRRRAGRGGRARPQPARGRRRGRAPRRRRPDERETLAVRPRLPQRRLPRRRAPRAFRSTRASGTIRNDGGRVVDESGAAVRGVYCAGWIKRGPTRRDRHEQEGRDGDGRAAPRGRATSSAQGRDGGGGRRAPRRARRARRPLRRAGAAIDEARAGGRRDARPARA